MLTLWNDLKKWLGGLFNDETGSPSSKRFVGIACGISLCVILFIEKNPNASVVDAVSLLAFGCLGLSSIDKYTFGKAQVKEAIRSSEKIEEIKSSTEEI